MAWARDLWSADRQTRGLGPTANRVASPPLINPKQHQRSNATRTRTGVPCDTMKSVFLGPEGGGGGVKGRCTGTRR